VNPAQRVEAIRAALDAAFAPASLEVIDDSHRHAGHAGARDGRGTSGWRWSPRASRAWGRWRAIARFMRLSVTS